MHGVHPGSDTRDQAALGEGAPGRLTPTSAWSHTVPRTERRRPLTRHEPHLWHLPLWHGSLTSENLCDPGSNQQGAEAHIHAGMPGACRAHTATELARSSPRPMLTPSPFPPDLLRTGFLMRGAWIAANICKASFRLTALLPHNTLGTRGAGGEGQTLSHSAGNQGSERVRTHARGNTASQQLFPHHPAHPTTLDAPVRAPAHTHG